jgi:hypothetical protein
MKKPAVVTISEKDESPKLIISMKAGDQLRDIQSRLKAMSRLVFSAADGPNVVKAMDIGLLLEPISDALEAWYEANIEPQEDGAA